MFAQICKPEVFTSQRSLPSRQNITPDLDPNCLQRLSTDGTDRQRVMMKFEGEINVSFKHLFEFVIGLQKLLSLILMKWILTFMCH